MSSEMDSTDDLPELVQRFQNGDPTAIEEIYRRIAGRMERLARTMLRNFPQVRRAEQTADVVQESMLSLLSALRGLHFSSTREFYGLVAEHIRRRLLDLHRRHALPHRRCQPLPPGVDPTDDAFGPDAQDDLDRWQAFHEAIGALPTAQREVVSLRLYHGWNADQIAQILQVSRRTVARLWQRAQDQLTAQLGDRLPRDSANAPPE